LDSAEPVRNPWGCELRHISRQEGAIKIYGFPPLELIFWRCHAVSWWFAHRGAPDRAFVGVGAGGVSDMDPFFLKVGV